ncbi:MAG: hypothetical protein HY692_02545 [Cyanobacteria bacterium NC_groundwater_1444_Ag_S-0.65um_54_12]|nr:hypothetical protein [Cyanobacteria bacterium NC_groundwater_1444_Ag_S-0.65um_54_12]
MSKSFDHRSSDLVHSPPALRVAGDPLCGQGRLSGGLGLLVAVLVAACPAWVAAEPLPVALATQSAEQAAEPVHSGGHWDGLLASLLLPGAGQLLQQRWTSGQLQLGLGLGFWLLEVAGLAFQRPVIAYGAFGGIALLTIYSAYDAYGGERGRTLKPLP